jgi:hypothetical protein
VAINPVAKFVALFIIRPSGQKDSANEIEESVA